MRKELRELRKEHKPVSKMKKADISAEIERMKVRREETPAPSSITPPTNKPYKAAVTSIKKAKEHEFPTTPDHEPAKKAAPQKKSMREKLLELLGDE